jgi:hypothetical protein
MLVLSHDMGPGLNVLFAQTRVKRTGEISRCEYHSILKTSAGLTFEEIEL